MFEFAYIDPGTGSMIVQGLIGGALAVAYAGRRVGLRAFRSAGRIFGKRNSPASENESADE